MILFNIIESINMSLVGVVFIALYLLLEHVLQVVDGVLRVLQVLVVERVRRVYQQLDVVVDFLAALVHVRLFKNGLVIG